MHLHYLESIILTGMPGPYLMVQDPASKAGLCWPYHLGQGEMNLTPFYPIGQLCGLHEVHTALGQDGP